jgi:hypothetical protein
MFPFSFPEASLARNTPRENMALMLYVWVTGGNIRFNGVGGQVDEMQYSQV